MKRMNFFGRNWRACLLLLMAVAGFILIASEPAEDAVDWMWAFVLSKICGVALCCVAYALGKRWADDGSMGDLIRWMEE